jgi:hypothetical protein
MKKMRQRVNLLFALELLDEMVRQTSIGPSYMEGPTRHAVAEALRRAKKRFQPKGIKPRRDQMPLMATPE